MQENGEPKFMQRFGDMGCQVACQKHKFINILFPFCVILSFQRQCFCLGDAYHITQPHTDGRGAVLAMTRALKQVRKSLVVLSFVCLRLIIELDC